jgi:hypothetical protein
MGLHRKKAERNVGHSKLEIEFQEVYGLWPTGTMLEQWLRNRPKKVADEDDDP